MEINEQLRKTMKNYLEQLFSVFEQNNEYAIVFGSKIDHELITKNKKQENTRIYLERLQEIIETMF